MGEMQVNECFIINKLVRRRKLGYPRYKRLSKGEKQVYMKSDLPLNHKILALAYNGFTKAGMKASLKWAKKHWVDYTNALQEDHLDKRNHGQSPFIEDEDHAYKEFLFKGYVPREQYSRDPNAWYIISNRAIKGVNFIYPKEYGHDYKSLTKYPDVYMGQSEVGIPGYTKADIKYTL